MASSESFSGLSRSKGAGTKIHRSQLKFLCDIGEGGYATVKKYEYTPAGGGPPLLVAVKQIKQGHGKMQDAKILAEYLRGEAELEERMSHPNILRVLGTGSMDESSEEAALLSLFIVMEYMQGGSLFDVVVREMQRDSYAPVYTRVDALRWLICIASGLDYLHSRKIVHRDIKLENILLMNRKHSKSQCCIADFGLFAWDDDGHAMESYAGGPSSNLEEEDDLHPPAHMGSKVLLSTLNRSARSHARAAGEQGGLQSENSFGGSTVSKQRDTKGSANIRSDVYCDSPVYCASNRSVFSYGSPVSSHQEAKSSGNIRSNFSYDRPGSMPRDSSGSAKNRYLFSCDRPGSMLRDTKVSANFRSDFSCGSSGSMQKEAKRSTSNISDCLYASPKSKSELPSVSQVGLPCSQENLPMDYCESSDSHAHMESALPSFDPIAGRSMKGKLSCVAELPNLPSIQTHKHIELSKDDALDALSVALVDESEEEEEEEEGEEGLMAGLSHRELTYSFTAHHAKRNKKATSSGLWNASRPSQLTSNRGSRISTIDSRPPIPVSSSSRDSANKRRHSLSNGALTSFKAKVAPTVAVEKTFSSSFSTSSLSTSPAKKATAMPNAVHKCNEKLRRQLSDINHPFRALTKVLSIRRSSRGQNEIRASLSGGSKGQAELLRKLNQELHDREPKRKVNAHGLAGSYMYMAPEMLKSNLQVISSKVDVFSFGMVMYELMHRCINYFVVFKKHSKETKAYALEVSKGYRPPINERLPARIIDLIKQCWQQNPEDRPSMKAVLEELEVIQSSGEINGLFRADIDAPGPCCTIS